MNSLGINKPKKTKVVAMSGGVTPLLWRRLNKRDMITGITLKLYDDTNNRKREDNVVLVRILRCKKVSENINIEHKIYFIKNLR